MELYLDAVRSHVEQLHSSSAPVSTELEASAGPNGLADGYKSFIVSTTGSIRQTADNEINVEQFVSQLSDEHHRHTSGRTTTEIGDLNTGSALNAHEKRRYQCQSNKPRLTCNHCDRDGHWLLRVKEKERRSSIVYRSKERENYRLIYERERKKTPCRLPKPEPKAEYQCRARLLSMGADEAGGGRRGRWGRPATSVVNRPVRNICRTDGTAPRPSVPSSPAEDGMSAVIHRHRPTSGGYY